MKTFAAAAALTVLAANTAAFSAQRQERGSAQSLSLPDTSASSYQYQDSTALGLEVEAGAEPDSAVCRVKRESMKDAATSTAFAATAAQDGMVEVALAGLALRKSGDNQMREFAEKIVQDYAHSNGGLDSIVKCEGLILPVELDAKHNALVRRLNGKSGRAFEKAYLKHMAERHSESVTLFQAASISGDPDIAAFARKGLSMLQEHQLLAEDLRAAIGTRVANTH